MLSFQKAEAADFEAAFHFIERLWTYNTYDREQLRPVYLRILQNADSFAFFAVDEEGEKKGFCHGDFFDTFWMSGRTCYISSLITEETARCRGYGTLMVDYVQQMAREQNCRAIILDSGFPREAAHRFYEHYGFEKSCYGFELLL